MHVSDRVGRQPVAIWSAAIIFLLTNSFFWPVNTEDSGLIWLAKSLWTCVLLQLNLSRLPDGGMLVGTQRSDKIFGLNGNDGIQGRGGGDQV